MWLEFVVPTVFLFCFVLFESERTWGRGRERERERQRQREYQADLDTGSISQPWAHDLSRNQESNAQLAETPRRPPPVHFHWTALDQAISEILLEAPVEHIKLHTLPGPQLRKAKPECLRCLQRALVTLTDSHSEHCLKVSRVSELRRLHSSPASVPLFLGCQGSGCAATVQGDVGTWHTSPISALPTSDVFLTLATRPSA